MHYVVGDPARQPNFYGRTATIQTVMGQSWTWICAQRRIGKTSVLYQIERSAQAAKRLPLLFDLAFLKRDRATPAELFDRFFREHHQHGGPLAQHGLSRDSFANLEPAECFRDLVLHLSKRGQSTLFLWDEAERLIDIENSDPGFLEQLRSHLHGLPGFQMVIAATQSMAALFGRPGHVSPFMATFRWMPLSGLDDANARDLLCCQNTAGWRSPLSATVIKAVLAYAGGHPLILQEMGLKLSEMTCFEGRAVTMALFEKCCNYLAGNPNLRAIIENDFSRLDKSQRSLLVTLCEEPQGLSLRALTERTGLPYEQAEVAAYFLSNYGYITTGSQLRLRFAFYRALRPIIEPASSVDAQAVGRLLPALGMVPETSIPSEGLTRAQIRRLLLKQLRSSSDIDAFCLDYFPDVKRRIASEMETTTKMNILLENVEPEKILRCLREWGATEEK